MSFSNVIGTIPLCLRLILSDAGENSVLLPTRALNLLTSKFSLMARVNLAPCFSGAKRFVTQLRAP